jgi:hypothetical protein
MRSAHSMVISMRLPAEIVHAAPGAKQKATVKDSGPQRGSSV